METRLSNTNQGRNTHLIKLFQDHSGVQQDSLRLMQLPLVILELMIEEQRLKEVLPTI